MICIFTMSFLGHTAFAQSQPLATLTQTCVACHGEKGQGVNPQWPKLAGQNRKYFIQQMQAFKANQKGGRENAIMYGIVANLTEQQFAALADYFAKEKPTYGKANADLVKLGQQIYRAGDLQSGVPACSACHGPRGRGNAEGGFPMLAGQYSEYTAAQLNAYKNGTRSNGINGMMIGVAKAMSEQQIQAVASYIAGLH